MSARRIVIEFLGDDKSFNRTMNAVQGRTSRFGSALRKIGAAAALGFAAAGVAAVKFGSDAISSASDLEESVNAVNVTFGKSADEVLALGEKAAAAVGLSKTEFNGLAVRFSSFAQTVAGKKGDVVGTLDDMTVRIADFASVMNLEVPEAADAFNSALAGETEPLRKFGIDLSAAAVEQHALRTGIIETGETMTESQKVQARYSLLMKETEKTAGDFANTSDSLANRQRVLKAEFENVKAEIGERLMPIMTKFMGWLLDEGIPALQKFAEWIGPKITKAIEVLGPFFSDAKDKAASFFDNFGPKAQKMADDLGPVFDTIKDTITTIVSTFQDEFLPSFRKLIKRIEKFWEKHGEKIVKFITIAWEIIGAVVEGGLIFVSGLMDTFGALITGDWQGVWDGVKKIVRGAWKVITGIVRGAWNLLVEIFGGALTRIRNILVSQWRTISGAFRDGFNAVKNIVTQQWANIRDTVSKGVDAVVTFVRNLPSRLRALGGLFAAAGRAIIGQFVDGMRNAAGIISGIAGNVWSAVKGLINGAITQINNALEFTIRLPGPDIHINPPNIPYLAKGTRNFAGGLAIVGENGPELVGLPSGSRVWSNAETTSMLAGTGGAGGTTTIVLQVDGQVLWKSLLRQRRLHGKGLGLA